MIYTFPNGSMSVVPPRRDVNLVAVRRWLNRFVQVLLLAEPPSEDCHRADPYMLCDRCGEKYVDHPNDPREQYLHVLCDRTRVKL